jgi:hypothetical protein
MEIQKLEVKLPNNSRVETGPVQFTYEGGREDWPGYFIRGDNAFALRLAIANILVDPHDVFARMQLQAYIQELDGCNMNQTLVKEMQNQDGREDGTVAGTDSSS